MKKKLISLFALLLALTCFAGQCHHVHDEKCGYNPETGEGCTHECESEIQPLDKWETDE